MLTMNPPVTVVRVKNPAQNFVDDNEMLFGYSEPSYNGTPVTQLDQTIAARQAVQTTINRNTPIAVAGRTYQSNLMVTGVPNHTITWQISMPPAPVSGGWEAADVPGLRIKELVNQINTRRQRDGLEVTEAMKPENHPMRFKKTARMTLRFEPYPNATEFMTHIMNHELQHVADHMWLAKKVIGRWDDVLMMMLNQHITLLDRTREGTNIVGIVNLFGYATGSARIPLYWKICTIDSGELYHETEEGADPVAKVVQITDTTVTVQLRPKKMITVAPNITINPQPHQSFAVKGDRIDGIELRMEAGMPAPFTKGIRKIHLRYYEPV